MATPSYKVTDLIPPVCQHTFTPEIAPSGLIDDEAELVALHGRERLAQGRAGRVVEEEGGEERRLLVCERCEGERGK